VPFEARDVMTDDEAYDALLALGYRRVPITVIGDVVIQGYDAEALAAQTAHLRVEGAPADAVTPPSE